MSLATKKGLAKGLEQGETKKSKEIAKNMLKKGMKIKDISEITGLTEEEIKNIKQKLM